MGLLDGLLADLAEESGELEAAVAGLPEESWRTPTPAAGWTVAHQIAHLAWTDELALRAAADPEGFRAAVSADPGTSVDDAAGAGARQAPGVLLGEWREGRAALAAALEGLPPGAKLPWFGPPMSAASMATARLMETWAHGVDVRDALSLPTPVTARLRGVAHLGVRTRGFAFLSNGMAPPEDDVRVELTGPAGEVWTWGAEDAAQRVAGPALDFCLRVTQRRHRADLALVAEGPDADRWLDLAQAFAGPPGAGRPRATSARPADAPGASDTVTESAGLGLEIAQDRGPLTDVPCSTVFHVLRNDAPRETLLLSALGEELGKKLPPAWSVTSSPQARGRSGRSDISLTLTAPDGTTATVLAAAKRSVEPRDVSSLLQQLASHPDPSDAVLVVAAPFLSPRAKELLEEAGAGWFDATGNLRLRIDRPSVFLDRVGASRNPFTDADDRRLKSLKGSGGARVVRALLDSAPPFGVRTLAGLAGVGAATSSRVLELLAREDLLARDRSGRVVDVRKLALARRWCVDYGLTSSNQAVPTLAARGIDHVLIALSRAESTYAITGEAATRPYLPTGQAAVTPVVLLTILVPDATAAVAALGVRPVDRGANVILVEPFDAVLFRGAVVKDGLTYAAASQVVADLLTGTGRAPEEGAALIRALADQDEGWRR